MKKKIIILAGDPNSINSEIIYKSWKKINNSEKKDVIIIGNFTLLSDQFKKLGIDINLIKVEKLNENYSFKYLKIMDIPLDYDDPFKVPFKNASTYVKKALTLGHNFALSKLVKGIINCPINKNLLNHRKTIGVTEFLAAKCNVTDNSEVMLIHNKHLSVVPLTTHINVRDISKNIHSDVIIKKVKILNDKFSKLFNKKPVIGILGLNPHNSEFKNSSEEMLQIKPAISKLKKLGINIFGPLAADTIFIENYKKYDVIIGMFHDQVLTPFKTLFHYDAINITLGLKYIRVSPDHGPAIDLIGQNKADYISLFKCIKFFKNLDR